MPQTDRHFTAETGRSALVVIAVVVAGSAFYWLSGILTPLALALFLMVMVDGLARLLRRRAPRLPQAAALPVAIVIALILFCLSVYVLAANLGGFAGQLLADAPKLDAVIAKAAGAMGLAVPPTLGQIVRSLSPTEFLGRIAGSLRALITDSVLVLIYLGFLLASRQGFERKTRHLFLTPGARLQAAELFLRIRNAIEQYLWIQAVTGGIIAVASWAVMAMLGLNNALFWAFAIFLVAFIPVIGGAIAILAPPLFALTQFQDWWRPAVMLVGLQIVNFIVGNIIYPRMQGRSLNIDPVAILLALAFWGAIWGLPGMFLSTPLTVMAMVILAQFRSTHWIAVLLSSDGDPLGEERHHHLDVAPGQTAKSLTQA
jgi:predicted PurR-regulated permease PerM